MKLPALAWRTIHRTQNRWWDLRATLAGYCNDRPVKTGVPGETNGYAHWRCALKRGHDGLHRYRNAVWLSGCRVDHEPVDMPPGQPWERAATPTIRQARNARRWHEEQAVARRARLREQGLLP
ncbi:hypothetical protein [Streptomyces coeruleorubidus]|uniref:Uncharacterized protein n=1 Tax=Streptomyces coeruleorubidus TaxID=116188 RepID=A0A5J6HYK6_STRC4|nr:hypothetical protein [Streptomyces coeruleorubidus]QEV23984.1 hypothetical protein CP976_07375 [Streptomyces coeruleorubidus]GGT85606.1 hypothetical protein GCM10010256_52140 [Streptomyces coeruleorubidus]